MTDPVRVPVLRVDATLPLPAYAREHDAGLDLHAAETVTLAPGARVLVPTGIALAIPPGYAGFVLPRSGLALRHGVTLLNTPGLIDAGYRGEVKLLLVNHGEAPVILSRGERVAQLVLQRVERVELIAVPELPPSARGSGGFGSSGGVGEIAPHTPPAVPLG
jgi:dUTP pyrophosphatase